VRHFHAKLREEHQIGLSYTWVKQALQAAGLVKRNVAAACEPAFFSGRVAGNERYSRAWPARGSLGHDLNTKHEFQNYYLKAEFKWGEGTFGPRAGQARDSGTLYNIQGNQITFFRWSMESLTSPGSQFSPLLLRNVSKPWCPELISR
jgi:hypothetical protein